MVAEDASDTSPPKRIRFKFMPTPTSRLHVGHAWLLVIMTCLARQAREAGYEADIVLVLDDLTSLGQGYTLDHMFEREKEILEDVAWLGVAFTEVVHNSSFPYRSNVQESHTRSVPLSTLAPASLCLPHLDTLVLGTQYYMKNCIVDAALGITHVIRGSDQLARAAIYKAFYELLGVPSPILVYLPFVCNAEGEKIGSHSAYSIETVKKGLSSNELITILVRQCLRRSEPDVADSSNIQEAREELLGDDWDWILGRADSDCKRTSFFERLESVPKVTEEQCGRQHAGGKG